MIPVCGVQSYREKTFCMKPAVWRYRGLRGGYQLLCEAHAALMKDYLEEYGERFVDGTWASARDVVVSPRPSAGS